MRFKPSLKQTVADHEKAIRWMCSMAGKPVPAEFAERAPEPAKAAAKPRKPPTPTDNQQLEAAVQREVFSVLAKHPAVLFAVRQNSGAAMSGDTPIWFYRWARRNGLDMTLTDFWGMLRRSDGGFAMFAIECKRRDWKRVSGAREIQQLAFIDVVRSAGGVGGFVTSAEDAIAILSQPLS